MTSKQIKYIKERAKGKTKISAARAAGYSENTAKKAKEAIEDHLDPLVIIGEMEECGLTNKAAFMALFDALGAKRGKDILYDTRIKAAIEICKLKGFYKDRVEHSGSISNPITDLVKKFHQDDE